MTNTKPATKMASKVNTKSSNQSISSSTMDTMDSAMPTSTSEPSANNTIGSVASTSELKANDATATVPNPVEVKFEQFPTLPPELRLKIWKLVPESRIVLVRFHRDGRKHQCECAASVPTILHSCRESRHEGLKIYHKAFDSKWALNSVYFNYKTDTLCMSSGAYPNQKQFFLRKIKASELNRIESVALKPGFASFGASGTVHKFPGLKEVIYMEFNGYYHIRMKSCSSTEGSFHTIEELLTFNMENPNVCYWLREGRKEFSAVKKQFEDGPLGATITIRHRYLCTEGIPGAQRYLFQ